MTKHTCITLWQPWASLCCIPHPKDPECSVKQFETRSWPTKKRGVLLIHAAKRFQWEERSYCHEPLIRRSLESAYGDDYCVPPRSAIIGAVWLDECHQAEKVTPFLDKYARQMGNYAAGRFAWEIGNPILFSEPIPYRGQQGLYSVPADVLPPEFESWREHVEVQHAG